MAEFPKTRTLVSLRCTARNIGFEGFACLVRLYELYELEQHCRIVDTPCWRLVLTGIFAKTNAT